MNRALLIVDVQKDFSEGGSLPIFGAYDVAGGITNLIKTGAYDFYYTSRDWHNPDETNSGHFSDTPDFVNSWPVHCVANTEGAEYNNWLDLSTVPYTEFRKGQGIASYSALEGRTVGDTNLIQTINKDKVSYVDVCGLAFDFCVRASAIDLMLQYYTYAPVTRVLTNLTASVSRITEMKAAIELNAAGVALVEAEGV